jgi:hypothetical protein
MSKRHPKTVPLDEWPSGWLTMETASLLDKPEFIMLHAHEKQALGYPSTDDEMREFIKAKRGEQ